MSWSKNQVADGGLTQTSLFKDIWRLLYQALQLLARTRISYQFFPRVFSSSTLSALIMTGPLSVPSLE